MADRPPRRPNRGGPRDRRDGASYRDDRDRRRYDDRDRDNTRRRPYRSRSRSRDRDTRRERSRSRDNNRAGRAGRGYYDGGRARGREQQYNRGDGTPRGGRHGTGDDKYRQRSTSPPRRRRSASPPAQNTADLPTRSKTGGGPAERSRGVKAEEDDDRGAPEPMDQDEEGELNEEDDDAAAMAAMMGFGGFGSTKGKKVAGNNVGAVSKEKKTEYRQYMNRVGGFNRPLSPSR